MSNEQRIYDWLKANGWERFCNIEQLARDLADTLVDG